MQPKNLEARIDFADAIRESYGPGQAIYIRDDIAQLRRIAAEIARHHETLRDLCAGLTLGNMVTDTDGRRARADHDPAGGAALECDFLDGLSVEAGALVLAEVEALFADDDAISAAA